VTGRKRQKGVSNRSGSERTGAGASPERMRRRNSAKSEESDMSRCSTGDHMFGGCSVEGSKRDGRRKRENQG
jgi:hypothetical protein